MGGLALGLPDGGARDLDVSFIIPCLNEQKNINRTVRDIRVHTPPDWKYEIIVVDHGSSDRTVTIAEGLGVRVLSQPDVKLGELRNRGARVSRGRTLIFLDADVSLTEQWQKNIGNTLERIESGERMVTGSRTEYLHADHWVQRGFGLKEKVEGQVPYLGTAHLIVDRRLFQELGGFPPDRVTGEDEAFGQRASVAGVPVLANPKLRAIHRGAPGSASEFFLRQLWHGSGDWESVTQAIRSRTATAGLLFVLAHLVTALGLARIGGLWPYGALGGIAIIMTLLVGKLWSRRRGLAREDLVFALIAFYLFFWARGVAPVARVVAGAGKRIGRR